jgi:phospholipase C
MRFSLLRRSLTLFAVLGALAVACTSSPEPVKTGGNTSSSTSTPTETSGPSGVFKLDHLIFIVQENRSFDHYFGT